MNAREPQQLEACYWTPEQLAWEALQDCEEFLDKGAIRKAIRAAHDAMHCALIILLRDRGSKYSLYIDKDKLVGFMENQPHEVIELSKKCKLFRVLSTHNLLEAACVLKLPQTPAVESIETLIEMRDKIEHPSPGIQSWDLPVCRSAICNGIAAANWALRHAGCTYGAGLDHQMGRIQTYLPELSTG